MTLLYILVFAVLFGALILTGGGATSRIRKNLKDQISKADTLLKGNKSEIKEAIILLDNLLDKSLQAKGFKGTSLGDRLKKSQRYFEWDIYTNVWESHKLRNRIVHDNYDPSGSEVKKSVKYFKLAINKLLK